MVEVEKMTCWTCFEPHGSTHVSIYSCSVCRRCRKRRWSLEVEENMEEIKRCCLVCRWEASARDMSRDIHKTPSPTVPSLFATTFFS